MEKTLRKFAEAIKEYEGWFLPGHPKYPAGSLSYRNNNPGNLRWSKFQSGTRFGFAYFKTYDDGFKALLYDLEMKFTGRTKTGLGPNSSILAFFSVYAPSADGNSPKRYAEFVASKFGVPITTKLGELVAMETDPKVKTRYQTKNDNAFVCLLVADDTIDKATVSEYVRQAQARIYKDSGERLVFDVFVTQKKMPMWDDQELKQWVKDNFEVSDFQAVIALYNAGKFRQDYGSMNPLDDSFGILIDQSFENPPESNASEVLVHELMHAFFFYLNKYANAKYDYTKEVHDTPLEFTDDFKKMGALVERLYYKRLMSDPAGGTAAVEPEHEPIYQYMKDGYKTSEFWLNLVLSVSGVLTAVGYFSPADADQFTKTFTSAVGGVFAIVSAVLYTWSRVKVKIGK